MVASSGGTGAPSHLMPANPKPKHRIRILVADREAVFRIGLQKLLALEDDLRVVAQAETAEQVAGLARKFRTHLIFIQKEIAEEGGGHLLVRLQRLPFPARIVVMGSGINEETARRFLKQGASGIILKSFDPQDFVRCARKVMQKGQWLPKDWAPPRDKLEEASVGLPLRPVDTLTHRERSIISCLLQGWRNREIATQLSITEQTVKNHLRTIFDKVGVSDRLELVLYAIHHRLELPSAAVPSQL